MESNQPSLIVGDVERGESTHARITMYPGAVCIQWGTYEGEVFHSHGIQTLAFRFYPELRNLYTNGSWNLEDVAALFDEPSDELYLMSEETRAIVRAYESGITAGAVSGGW